MKINFVCLIVIILILNINFVTPSGQPVVNSCGTTETKISGTEPTNKDACKDSNEPDCKLVKVYKVGSENEIDKQYCAVIHGKTDDNVLNSVKTIIGRKIAIE